jgi:hypothetical protein
MHQDEEGRKKERKGIEKKTLMLFMHHVFHPYICDEGEFQR